MKTLVTYMTQTGNTKKIAEAIYGEVAGEKDIKDIKDVSNFESYDLVFVGFPVIQFTIPPNVSKFVSENAAGKDIAFFMTHGVPEGFEAIKSWTGSIKDIAADGNLLGTFECQGEIAQNVLDMLEKSDDPEMKAFAELGPGAKGQPDEAHLQKAKEFAKEIQAKVQ
ncbi:flavodoxin [Methanococcoides alaskense]|uniref:Flavodoxin n=1 Tax=Methanococcoides alaskense TaxID=325778 RepID=A0AA90TXB8_9EURY|nr:flavodoxin family protein [Methanococcoides alaskense]MDA0525367.1 flavodoxin domain-containing protein [Methanococcoides alaskense]MDR6221702.1 flavodoxin [Methanococcoides alaskense]